jgi:eukaryotic-like serine/threonine-protein kinase
VSGGPSQVICDAPSGSDGTWSSNGTILLDGTGSDPILRVDASGGVAKAEVSPTVKTAAGAGWPEFLPDGRHYLYMTEPGAEGSTLLVGTLDSKEPKVLFKTMSKVTYAAPGYLLYVREKTLVAQPFDAASQQVKGEPIPVGEGLGIGDVGAASFSLSTTGVLAFRAGETQGRRMLWMDRSGKETEALAEPKNYADAWFSPDGKRLVYDVISDNGNGDIWIRDLTRGVTTRFTFDPEREFDPIWSPDGRKIVYSKQGKNWDLYIKDASGAGEAEVLFASGEDKYASDWSKDGRYLIFHSLNKDTSWDVWALPMTMTGEKKPMVLAHTKFPEHSASLSPDGRYLAYRSNESGRNEVYVQEFPEAKSKWQVSAEGGTDPFWKGDGREIYFRSRDSRIMAVPVLPGATFSTGTPQALFQARFSLANARGLFRPTPDGQRFLVLSPLPKETIPPTTVVLNWASALK